MKGLLALFAGAMAALGHAPFSLWPLALLGFLSLYFLVSRAERRAGWIAWAGGVGYFATSMHWIVEPFLVDIATHGWMAPFALILLAGGLAMFWGLAGWAAMRMAGTPGTQAIAFSLLLTAAEMVRGHIFTGFPWALPAYIWADTPLRAASAWTGSYGLSLVTLLAVAVPLTGLRRPLGITLGALLLLVPFAAGQMRLQSAETPASSLGTVRLVQPNVPQAEKWNRDKAPGHQFRLLDLTGGAGEPVDMIVWPEVALVQPLDMAGPVLEQASDIAEAHAGGAPVLLGINRRADGNFYNAMVLTGEGGRVQEIYDKVHLVPFGEYIPLKINLLRSMAGFTGFGFTAGDKVRLIETPLGRALPLICYEGIFPRQIFKSDTRADYLLQITNDAWFGTFSGPFQHLDQARFRAAEHGLSLVRAANTGISTVIDPFGRTLSGALPLGTAGFIDRPVPRGTAPTLYARTGDSPLIVILLLTLAVLSLHQRRNAIAKGRTKA